MNRYFENFIQHSGQIDSFLAATTVWIAFAAIGSLFLGRDKIIEAVPLYGWAVVSFALTALGVLKFIPFSTLGAAAGLAAVASGVIAARAIVDERQVLPHALDGERPARAGFPMRRDCEPIALA